MESVVHDQHDARPGWLAQKPFLGKRVRFQFPIFESPHSILYGLVFAVQGGKIEVRGSITDSRIAAIGTKKILDNQYPTRTNETFLGRGNRPCIMIVA